MRRTCVADPGRQLRRPPGRRRRCPHAHAAAARPHLLRADHRHPVGRPAALRYPQPDCAHAILPLDTPSRCHRNPALPHPAHPVLLPFRSHRRPRPHPLSGLGQHPPASAPALWQMVQTPDARRQRSCSVAHHLRSLQRCTASVGGTLEARAERDYGYLGILTTTPSPTSSARLDHLRRALLRPGL